MKKTYFLIGMTAISFFLLGFIACKMFFINTIMNKEDNCEVSKQYMINKEAEEFDKEFSEEFRKEFDRGIQDRINF